MPRNFKPPADPSGPVTARAFTSLAQTEDRIRRSLNLVGDVGLTFGPEMTPVVIAGDATAIGSATYRGRRFTYSTPNAISTVGAESWFIKALDNVVLTQIRMVATSGVGIRGFLGVIDAATADPAVTTTPFALWSERFATANDLAPLVRSSFNPGVLSAGFRISTFIVQNTNVLELLVQPFLLTPLQKLAISVQGVTTLDYVISGYVY